MPLYVNVIRATTAAPTTVIDAEFLNLMGTPIVEVTGTIDGTGSIDISDGSITTAKLQDASSTDSGVTNGKAAWMPTLTVKGNDTGVDAAPQDLTVAEVRSLLSVEADGVTLEHYSSSGGKIKVMDASITAAKLAGQAVTSPALDLSPPAVITGTAAPETNLNVATAVTFNCEPTGNASYTLQWVAADEGKSVIVRLKSPGSYTAAFAVSGEVSLTLRWKGGVAGITPSSTAGQVDLVSFTRIGTQVYAVPVQSFLG